MSAGVFGTPRAVPSLFVPMLFGGAVVALALPVVVAAGAPLRGWVLGVALWAAGQALGLLLARLPLGAGNLAASGVVGIGMMFRAIAVGVVLVAVAASDARLGVTAALVYASSYSLELGILVASYFGGRQL